MQYIQTIFENENIRSYVENNEVLIALGANVVASYKQPLTAYVQENLVDFIEAGDITATYENIKTFIIAENLYLMEAVSSILSDVTLTQEETIVALELMQSKSPSKLSFLQKHKKALIAGGLAAGAAGAALYKHTHPGADLIPGVNVKDAWHGIKSTAKQKFDDVTGRTELKRAAAEANYSTDRVTAEKNAIESAAKKTINNLAAKHVKDVYALQNEKNLANIKAMLNASKADDALKELARINAENAVKEMEQPMNVIKGTAKGTLDSFNKIGSKLGSDLYDKHNSDIENLDSLRQKIGNKIGNSAYDIKDRVGSKLSETSKELVNRYANRKHIF